MYYSMFYIHNSWTVLSHSAREAYHYPSLVGESVDVL